MAIDLLENVRLLQTLLTAQTGSVKDASKRYSEVRAVLLGDPVAEPLTRSLIASYATLDRCLGALKKNFPNPAERQKFLEDACANITAKLSRSVDPTEAGISLTLEAFDQEHVYRLWRKATERCQKADYQGAITLARTLLEAVCKRILAQESAPAKKDHPTLPELYRMVADQLDLSPAQVLNEDLKRVLGGCSTIVGALAALRNKSGDAHDGGVRPQKKHAELAVRISGAMAAFLVTTLNDQLAQSAVIGEVPVAEQALKVAVGAEIIHSPEPSAPSTTESCQRREPTTYDGSAATIQVPKEVFVSYAWEDGMAVVDQLSTAFHGTGITLIRDKDSLRYRDNIRDFMKRMGRGKCIVVVLSKAYLKSKNCMFELNEIAGTGNFRDRVFPIVLQGANIYKGVGRLDYVHFWEQEISALNAKLKQGDSQNLKGILQELDLLAQIRTTIDGIVETLGEMNALSLKDHRSSQFAALLQALRDRLSE